jgi:hypothetical protein
MREWIPSERVLTALAWYRVKLRAWAPLRFSQTSLEQMADDDARRARHDLDALLIGENE